MLFIRILIVLLILPVAWIHTIIIRKNPFSQRYTSLHAWSLRVFRILKVPVIVDCKQELPKDVPLFFVSNHQGTFDPLVLVAGISTPMSFISKKENKKIPIISSFSKTLELIYFDRNDTASAVHMLRESSRYLKRNQNLLIFPEGTRSKGKKMLPMKEGALQPAYMGKAWIVPITQINTYDIWNCTKRRIPIKLIQHKPIPYTQYQSMSKEELIQYLEKTISSGLV